MPARSCGSRFRREAELVASLRHPNIVQVHETGEHGDFPYFSLEFMDGGSLNRQIAGQPLPPRDAAEIVATLARAVQHAHECGIVHRDLKPSNILLQRRSGLRRGPVNGDGAAVLPVGRLCDQYYFKVADFGLARELDEDATRTGQVLGTPSYMAPEQAEGHNAHVGPAADVYGLGAILYELLTGRPPFKGKTPRQTLEMVRRDEPVPPRHKRPGLPRDLEAVCLKCLEKSPQRRYPSAQALADDLDRWRRGEPTVVRPPGLIRRAGRVARRHAIALTLGIVVCAAVAFGYRRIRSASWTTTTPHSRESNRSP